EAKTFIPVSGREGDGIAKLTEPISWFKGSTVLEVLDSFEKEKPATDKPFRMPVQAVYKFTNMGDDRRIVSGTVETGSLSVNDTVVFYPSGKKSKPKSIERFNAPSQDIVSVNEAAGFTLEEQIYITRGEIAVKDGEKAPKVGKKIKVSLFWLGRKPFEKNKDYFLKIGTAKVNAKLDEIQRVINASNLDSSEDKKYVGRNEVAECTLKLEKAIAFDLSTDIDKTSRFVIVDDFEIAGGGIILEVLEDKFSQIRDNVIIRNYKWEKSIISPEQRAEKYNQKSALLLITGPREAGKKEVAKALESQLFIDGKIVYFLGIGNVKYGIDTDLDKGQNSSEEHLRRLAEVAHILLDSGVILIVTARSLTQNDLEIIKTIVNPEKITSIWAGEDVTTDLSYDVKVPGKLDIRESTKIIKTKLYEGGVIFRPW
ncbi:MAG: adenylyl-sulfate kinase, partial [Ignavibacteriales bacterium]|nr:adenylyl-sulfate kinase [Ignavibacteriales bacterium]